VNTLTELTTAEMALRAALQDAQDQIKTLKKQLSGVLVEGFVEPATGELEGLSDKVDATDVHKDVLASVAETLMDELNVGLRPDELSGRALHFLREAVSP
jgi:hypothetical protein